MTSLPMLLLIALATAVLTHLLIPLFRRLGLAWGLLDHPSWRRNQTEAVPCSGGLAIYGVTALAGLALLFVVGLPFHAGALVALGLAGLGTIVLGVLDDRFGLHAEKKLLGQIVVVSLPMAAGLTLEQIHLPGLGVVELGILAGPVTLFWYLGFINSVNLIDGLDGLAGGIVVLVLGALCVAVLPQDPVGALWVLVLLGAVVGFLRNNLSGRRIFLGDAGSMLLGLWLAGLTLGLADASPIAPGMVVAAMAVPVIDTSTTILRRWRRGVSVFRADDEHLHHRLLRLGTTPHRAAACLWFVTIACASLGALAYGHSSAGILALGAGAAAAIELAYTLPREGDPQARAALLYLLGLRPRLREADTATHLAEVIEMTAYRHTRRSPGDRPAAARVSGEENAARPSETPAAKVGAAGEADDDVVLAATDEPR